MKRYVLDTVAIFYFLCIASLVPANHVAAMQSKNYDAQAIGADAVIVDISWRGSYWLMGKHEPNGAFSIDVKNTGTKTIAAVDWEFILVDSVRGKSDYDHFKFQTKDKKIKPGETKRLTKRFNYHEPPDYIEAKAKLMRIEYTDGSVWTRPSTNGN